MGGWVGLGWGGGGWKVCVVCVIDLEVIYTPKSRKIKKRSIVLPREIKTDEGAFVTGGKNK